MLDISANNNTNYLPKNKDKVAVCKDTKYQPYCFSNKCEEISANWGELSLLLTVLKSN